MEVVNKVAAMLYDEPVLMSAIELLYAHCLGGGLNLRYGGTTPATPAFQQHITRHYAPFCKDAILSFLAVGFAPYRLRTSETGAQIPEVLPLGTFSWYVGRRSGWGTMGEPPAPPKQGPLLQFEVTTTYCADTIRVHPFVQPQALFTCTSRYARLLAARSAAAPPEAPRRAGWPPCCSPTCA